MPSPWISHVKAYCAKHGCSYKEGLSKARASYKPVARGGYREPMPRVIGGAKTMKLAELKSQMKSMGHKLSRMVNGVRKAYNKNEIVKMLVDKGAEGAGFSGGKVNRRKKATKWTDFAVQTAKKGIDLAKEVGLGGKADGKVNRMRKAQKWSDFAVQTAKKGIGLAKEAKELF
jgi:hypothetical protein